MQRPTRKRVWRWVMLVAALLLIFIAAGAVVWSRTDTGRAAFNIVEYRLRIWWIRLLGVEASDGEETGAISGTVSNSSGEPIPDALVLVASARGIGYHSWTNTEGEYSIESVPSGKYVPVASAWGFDDQVYSAEGDQRTAIRVHQDRTTEHIDFVLPSNDLWVPDISTPPQMDAAETGYALFPAEVEASRVPVTFVNEGLTITTTMIYEPMDSGSSEELLPVLVASYPSEPLNWDRVSVAIASEGYVVVASGPSPQRGLDIAGMSRDLLKTVGYLRSGQLSARADIEREGWLAGSFSSIILYQALREQPGGVDGLVIVGGVSDALLGVQVLYTEGLEIPPRYSAAIASLGRPDRYPDTYVGYSPAFFASHLPPTIVVHTTSDEVIPPNQASRLDEALEAAGVPHELYLYSDTTHYLDQVNVTPETAELYRRLLLFLDTHVRAAG